MEVRSHGPLEALFRPPAVIAVLLAGEALAAILALAPGTEGDRWVRFGLASLGTQWAALGTLAVLYLAKRPLARLPRPALAWICLTIFMAMTLLVACAAWFLSGLASTATGNGAGFVIRLLTIALVVGLLGLVAYQNYADAKRLAIRAKQAELEALQARIHPHFLFNTLNSAAALVHARPDDAERVLLDLGDLFRAALSEPGWVPVAHELDLCRRYLAIEQQRFGDRLRVEWRVDDGLDGLSVPLLTIQPLVENAVAHGLDERSGAKSLCVEAAQTATELVVSVRNAVPRDAAAVERNGHSVGLAGVRARVESVTQGTGSVVTESNGASFVVRVVLPKAAMPAQGRIGAR